MPFGEWTAAAPARRLSQKEMAEACLTSWEEVFDAVEHVVTCGLEHRTLGEMPSVSNEIQYAKGNKARPNLPCPCGPGDPRPQVLWFSGPIVPCQTVLSNLV